MIIASAGLISDATKRVDCMIMPSSGLRVSCCHIPHGLTMQLTHNKNISSMEACEIGKSHIDKNQNCYPIESDPDLLPER